MKLFSKKPKIFCLLPPTTLFLSPSCLQAFPRWLALFRHPCRGVLICISIWKSLPGDTTPPSMAVIYLQSCVYWWLKVDRDSTVFPIFPPNIGPPTPNPVICWRPVVFHRGTGACPSLQVHLGHIPFICSESDLNVNPSSTNSQHSEEL